MIISFAWTTPALLAGAKTVTRREWSPEHVAKFWTGMLVDAWDGSTRQKNTRGTRKVATIRLTKEPRMAWSDDITEADEFDEGFVWLRGHGEGETVDAVLASWRKDRRLLYIVEFELVEVLAR